ncbi:hypothetical protein CDAR_489751 [Caerostris darwini]|uniref:Uncharacterized protein n=1 Tax=Caerostris darwini TaxID=1538125 RepID=A0AAV4VIG7_9ARAC|nr:hypothetical protein CDAR_489751 [Caerostris darwini]
MKIGSSPNLHFSMYLHIEINRIHIACYYEQHAFPINHPTTIPLKSFPTMQKKRGRKPRIVLLLMTLESSVIRIPIKSSDDWPKPGFCYSSPSGRSRRRCCYDVANRVTNIYHPLTMLDLEVYLKKPCFLCTTSPDAEKKIYEQLR